MFENSKRDHAVFLIMAYGLWFIACITTAAFMGTEAGVPSRMSQDQIHRWMQSFQALEAERKALSAERERLYSMEKRLQKDLMAIALKGVSHR